MALDLYCGVGLFAGALAAAGARVWGIEGDRRAVELAAGNVPGAPVRGRRRGARAAPGCPARADLVVLDPPRAGAGAARAAPRSPRGVRGRSPTSPATRLPSAATCRTAAGLGYRPTSVTAYDLFPMTHHVECVAILEPR